MIFMTASFSLLQIYSKTPVPKSPLTNVFDCIIVLVRYTNVVSMKANKEYEWELAGLLQDVAKDRKLTYLFLQDLLSPFELTDVATRWQIVKQLDKKISHHKIARNLHIGVATVTRGSRMLENKQGGFNQVLNKYGHKKY